MGTRFFDISMFSSLHRPDATQSMPMVRSGKADRIIVEELAHISIAFHRTAGKLLILASTLAQYILIDIAESDHLCSGLPVEASDVSIALSMNSHYSHPNPVVCAKDPPWKGKI